MNEVPDCQSRDNDRQEQRSFQHAETEESLFFFFRFCAGQRFIAALSHTGGQARKN